MPLDTDSHDPFFPDKKASLEKQEHKAVQSQSISRHKAQPRHSNVASLYLSCISWFLPCIFRHAATTRFSSLPLYSPLLSSLCTPLLYLSKCSLSYISISLCFALYAALLLSPLFSVLFALLLSPPLFIPLYAALHRSSWFLLSFHKEIASLEKQEHKAV